MIMDKAINKIGNEVIKIVFKEMLKIIDERKTEIKSVKLEEFTKEGK